MIKSKTWMRVALVGVCAASAAAADAQPVVYTLRTVADGRLGSRSFTQALVMIRLRGSTSSVQQQAGTGGGPVWTNAKGVATVTVDDGYRTTTATFAPGEVYVRYDTNSGIFGFGSPISPTYPIALGCADSVDASYVQDCAQGDWTTVNLGSPSQQGMYNGVSEGLADVAAIPADRVYVSDAVLALPTNLTQTTLLSGRAHTCAVAYTIVPPAVPNQASFFLDKCPSPAPRGLVTSKGPFFLQDQFGVNFGTEENTGTLQVEVLADDTDEGND
jgi:hypothetical protein